MVVVKHPMNSKGVASRLFYNPCDLSDALDPQLFSALIRRRNQNLNSNIRPDWRTPAAEDESAVQCNITREASIRSFGPVVPVKEDRQPQLVSNRSSALQTEFENFAVPHENETTVSLCVSQAAESLKIE